MCEWKEPRLLDQFRGRLRLEGCLTTRAGLHIGAGDSGDPLGTDLRVVRNATGDPYIPGSSLKGVIRSAAEALFRSSPSQEDKRQIWSCNVFSDPCVPHEFLKKEREKLQRDVQNKKLEEKALESTLAETVWKKSCPICRLFGSLALAGRVRFPDLPLSTEIGPLEIRNGVAIDRDKELAVGRMLFDYEAVPPGTSFDLTVIVDNPVDAEIGLLLYLFDELHQGHLSLGGKTSRGLGLVEVEWTAMHETKRSSNPFRERLQEKDLLAPEDVGETAADAESEMALPASGNAEDWKILADVILELPKVDKGDVARIASERGDLSKSNLNERLDLGLSGKRLKKSWDAALDRLVDCGFLLKRAGEYVVAGREQASAADVVASPEETAQRRAREKVYEKYIGAMSDLWEEHANVR